MKAWLRKRDTYLESACQDLKNGISTIKMKKKDRCTFND